jgi:hypothetical protein
MLLMLGMGLTAKVLAQTSAASASSAPKTAEASKAQEPRVDVAKEFSKLQEYVRKRGRYTVLAGAVCTTLGLTRTSGDNSTSDQVTSNAYQSDIDDSRAAYLLDRREIILTAKVDNTVTMYLADGKGKLLQAAMMKQPHQVITRMSLTLAGPGFEAEKKFWSREMALNTE